MGAGKTYVPPCPPGPAQAKRWRGRVYGHDVTRAADDVRRHVGFLAHTPGLYDDLTARENLRFAAGMLGRSPMVLRRRSIGLASPASQTIGCVAFSAGMQRRLALARLMLMHPRLLLLDEPYANLDAAGIDIMNAWSSQKCERMLAARRSSSFTDSLRRRACSDRVLSARRENGRIAAEGTVPAANTLTASALTLALGCWGTLMAWRDCAPRPHDRVGKIARYGRRSKAGFNSVIGAGRESATDSLRLCAWATDSGAARDAASRAFGSPLSSPSPPRLIAPFRSNSKVAPSILPVLLLYPGSRWTILAGKLRRMRCSWGSCSPSSSSWV